MLGTIHSLKLTEHLKIGLPSTKVVFQSIFRCKLAVSSGREDICPFDFFSARRSVPTKLPPNARCPIVPVAPSDPTRIDWRSVPRVSPMIFGCFETLLIAWEIVVGGWKKKTTDEPNAIEGDSLTISRFFLVRMLSLTPRAKDTTLMDKTTLAGKARFSVEVFLVR